MLRIVVLVVLLQRLKDFLEYRIPGIMLPQAENPLVCMADKFARNINEIIYHFPQPLSGTFMLVKEAGLYSSSQSDQFCVKY